MLHSQGVQRPLNAKGILLCKDCSLNEAACSANGAVAECGASPSRLPVNTMLPSAGDDIRKLEAGVHIVSGTPGRVFDMIKRRSLRTRNIKVLVLDEADEMLNKGFREQIYDIYRCAADSGL